MMVRESNIRGLAAGKAAIGAVAVVVMLLSPGCGTLTAVLSPDLVAALGVGESVSTIPGDAPEILVTSRNDTGNTVQMIISYRDGEGEVRSLVNTIQAGGKSATALPCPVTEITLGDISDLDAAGARVILGAGDPIADPFVNVEPFGVLLRDRLNYSCGDSLTFSVQLSGATRSGYQTFFYVQRSDAAQP